MWASHSALQDTALILNAITCFFSPWVLTLPTTYDTTTMSRHVQKWIWSPSLHLLRCALLQQNPRQPTVPPGKMELFIEYHIPAWNSPKSSGCFWSHKLPNLVPHKPQACHCGLQCDKWSLWQPSPQRWPCRTQRPFQPKQKVKTLIVARAWKSSRYGSHSYVGFLHFEALFRSSEHLIDQHLHKHYVRICANTRETRTVWYSPALCFVSCSCQILQMLLCLGCWCWCRSWTHPQTDLNSTWFGCLGYLALSAILGLIFLASFYRGSIHGI